MGSAALGAIMAARLSANGVGGGGGAAEMETSGAVLPEPLREPFAAAMAESLWLPAGILLIGLVAVLAFDRPASQKEQRAAEERSAAASA